MLRIGRSQGSCALISLLLVALVIWGYPALQQLNGAALVESFGALGAAVVRMIGR